MKRFILSALLLLIGLSLSAQVYLEEPARKAGQGPYITVTTTVDGTPVRSFTYRYDTGKRISLWVAYPLNTGLIGTGSRGDGWTPSPDISERQQAVLYKGFQYGSGYDRGHQIPSADRLRPEANAQTFVFTNATPQNHDFNAGIWADLEKLVRTWAKRSDTLYVVTGVVPGTKTINDNAGHPVNIPFAYYKTVLRKNTDRYGKVHWSTCSVMLLHSDIREGTWPENLLFFKENSLSLAELEKITGETYFPLAEKIIGSADWQAMKRTEPSGRAWWWK